MTSDINGTSTPNSNENPVPISQVYKFSAKDVTSTYGKLGQGFRLRFWTKWKTVEKQTVTFKVAGKTYNVNSNSMGLQALIV